MFCLFVSAPWAPSRVDMCALQIFIIIIIIIITFFPIPVLPLLQNEMFTNHTAERMSNPTATLVLDWL